MMHPDITASRTAQHRTDLHRSATRARLVESAHSAPTRAPRPTPATHRPPRVRNWILAAIRTSGVRPAVVS